MAKSIRAKKLWEASQLGSRDLLTEMKKIKGKKKSHEDLPDIVAGVSGEDQIVEEFRKVYQALYNSCDSSDGVEIIKDKLQNMIGNDISVHDTNLVTGQVLKEAACRMKPGKGDVSGSYTSDAILNAPDSFFDIMSIIFRSWLIYGTVTLSLLACAFLPLFKGGLKDLSKIDSYRAIAGASLILKLFDNVVLLVWESGLEVTRFSLDLRMTQVQHNVAGLLWKWLDIF